MKKLINKTNILLFMILIPFLIFLKAELIASLLIIGLIIFLFKKYKFNKFILIIFLLSMLLKIIIIFIIKTPPESDFNTLYNASLGLLNGDTSFNNDSYFIVWSYQIGFVWFQSIFLKIINSIYFLKILNCIFSSLICVYIYLISKEFCKDKYAKITSILYLILPFSLTYVTVLTNQHLSTLLILISIYILVKKNSKLNERYRYILSGILLSISNIIRPEGIVIIISIIIYVIFLLNKSNYKNKILNLILLFVCYYGIFFAFSTVLYYTNIAPNGLGNKSPEWKFVTGLNTNTCGTYATEDLWTINNKKEARLLIKDRLLQNPIVLKRLFECKTNSFWNNPNLEWSLYYMKDNTISLLNNMTVQSVMIILCNYSKYFLNIIYIFVLICLINIIIKKKYEKPFVLLYSLVFITFGVYLFIEVQPRYIYFIQTIIFILSSIGIEIFVEFIDKFFKKIFMKNSKGRSYKIKNS